MEHLFDEIEAAAASARYRSPPPSVASTRYSECDTQIQYDSDTETNIWSKYYPRPQCPPGPLGYPKPRSPEGYKVFKWKEQQRKQSTDSLQTPRPNLPGLTKSTRPSGAPDASTSKLPGFGNYRRGPGTVTATVSHQPTPSWEATLQAVNAASGSSAARNRKLQSQMPEFRQPTKKAVKPALRPANPGMPDLAPVVLSSPSKTKAKALPVRLPASAGGTELFAAPGRVAPSQTAQAPRKATLSAEDAVQDIKPSLVSTKQDSRQTVGSSPPPSLPSETVLASPVLKPVILAKPCSSPIATASDEKRKQLPKLTIPDTEEEASVDKVTLADALALLSASMQEKTDLDVLELLKLGLEQSKMQGKRDRSQRSAISATPSAGSSPRSRPPLRKRLRQKASKLSPKPKSSAGNDSLSPPSASSMATSASPLTPQESGAMPCESMKDKLATPVDSPE